MTFRREMEEMSKKTKRLEKENHSLTRKHELTSSNILQMAEDRQKAAKELELLKKKNENLEKLCRGMQAQGRGGTVMQQAQQQARLAQQQQQVATQTSVSNQPGRPTTSSTSNSNLQDVAPQNGTIVDGLDGGTESDYDYGDEEDDLDDEGSDLGEYDDDTEEETHAVLHHVSAASPAAANSVPPQNLPQGQRALPSFGPSPPPPVSKSAPLPGVKSVSSGGSGNESKVGSHQSLASAEKGKQPVMNGLKH